MKKPIISLFLFFTVFQIQAQIKPEQLLKSYRDNLNKLRQDHKNVRRMPDLHFFLFGMGNRPKMIYHEGKLKDAKTGQVKFRWNVKKEVIVPSEYMVYLETEEGKKVTIRENEKGVYIVEGKKKTALATSKLSLPEFKGHPFAQVLKTLHHEILINIDNGKPVPNFMVYKKPWYRDATLMGMVLKHTGNLHVIQNWIMNIRDPFDRNNHGISEADNPGEVLFLISLVSDKNHPAVKPLLDSAKQFDKGDYIEGKTDYSLHPVFQTKWMKYGLKSLGLPDKYKIPRKQDTYSSLFWWDYKDQHIESPRFDAGASQSYPYLAWAEDHFYGEKNGIVTDRDYPLSWEANASDANYPGLGVLDEGLAKAKLSPPHTWHAAEMFLYLIEQKSLKKF
jgi:hypothetical protein